MRRCLGRFPGYVDSAHNELTLGCFIRACEQALACLILACQQAHTGGVHRDPEHPPSDLQQKFQTAQECLHLLTVGGAHEIMVQEFWRG